MNVLVGCEFSGVVRDAFTAQGHDAWSCDLEPTERPGPHIQGNVLDLLREGWDLALFFPPCTYLCNSGARWWPQRQTEQQAALALCPDPAGRAHSTDCAGKPGRPSLARGAAA